MTEPVHEPASLSRSLPPVYAAAALRLAFPLVLLPLMAARLGAEAFGQLSLVLVWAALLSTLVEGGFLAAATRLAVPADAAGRARLAQQVFAARVAWSGVVLAGAAVVGHALLRGQPGGVAATVALAAIACALGWPATWYLQASQQLHRWARVEIAVYAAWALAVLVFAHGVLAFLVLQALAGGVLAAAGWAWLRRDLRAELAAAGGLWRRDALRPGLALGATMLPVSVAGAAYSYALPAVASATMARSELGLYYLADRLVRALLAAADPVYQLVYPRIVQRFAGGARAALRYALRWAAAGTAAGALLWALGWVAWGWLGPLWAARGSGIATASLAPVLAVLGLLLPLLLGWKFVGYWMLGSTRLDTAYRSCILLGAAAGVAGAFMFGGQGAWALAWTALAVEALVIATALAGSWLTLRRPHRPS